ncbi:MAG: hypothetical protein BHV68_21135 [Bacteroidales bacterium 43_8]|nr:MAG: hypothetical protein BHV68_21135 [Bacteroidales bacterium 43_8]
MNLVIIRISKYYEKKIIRLIFKNKFVFLSFLFENVIYFPYICIKLHLNQLKYIYKWDTTN